jgi:hypothetical protein
MLLPFTSFVGIHIRPKVTIAENVKTTQARMSKHPLCNKQEVRISEVGRAAIVDLESRVDG